MFERSRRLKHRIALAGAAIVLVGIGGAAEPASGASPSDTRARPGTLAVGARAADPEGGREWAVRTYRPRGGGRAFGYFGRRPVQCLQAGRLEAGRLEGGRLLRTFASGDERVLRPGDRSVCVPTDQINDVDPPLAVERLTDDPAVPRRFVRTVVAGIAPADVTGVTLTVRGEPRAVTIESATRSYLAVLDGSVRRADLALRFARTEGRRDVVIDFATGTEHTLSPGSVRRGPEVADPLGGPPFAVLGYGVGGRGGTCAEAGRVIAGEVGPYEARYGSFLDAPTLGGLAQFVDRWAPTGPAPGVTGDCGDPRDREMQFRVQRFDDRVAVVQGLAGARVRAIEIRGPGRKTFPVALEAGLLVGAVPSDGILNERIRVVATLTGGRRVVRPIALGPEDVATRWHSYERRGGGRVLRIRWDSRRTPFSGARVARRGRSVAVTILERYPPVFSDDGFALGLQDIGITKCVDIVLPRALRGRPVVAGRPRGRVSAEDRLTRGRCRRVRPRTA